jgi:hypothetical protein
VETRNHPLTDQQVEENKVIEGARRKSFSHSIFSPFQSSNDFLIDDIEQFFSDVKGRFEVLRKEFQFSAGSSKKRGVCY